MKKLIAFFVLVFCFVAGYSETGYNGHQWWATKTEITNSLIYLTTPEITEENKEIWEYTVAEKKNILGSQTFVYYHFLNTESGLMAISYSIDKSKTKQLKEKYTDKILETKIQQIEDNYIPEKEIEYQCEIERQLFNVIIMNDDDYLRRFEGTGGILTVYNYNNDTRVYIFENFIKNRTFVFYAYHEQDY